MASCDVHLAALPTLHHHHLGYLDVAERSRSRRYRLAADRDRFVLGAILLRVVAGRALGRNPGEVVVDRTCERCHEQHGKPRLVGTGLEASVSHSGELVAVAASEAGPLGVDIEEMRQLDYGSLLADVCTQDEQQFVTSPVAFYTYWTRKEAFLKATGVGLTQPMHELTVTPPSEPPAALRVGNHPAPRVQMLDLHPSDGFVGAIAVLTALPLRCTVHDASTLLATAGELPVKDT